MPSILSSQVFRLFPHILEALFTVMIRVHCTDYFVALLEIFIAILTFANFALALLAD
jgi:hypothetical protein